MIINLQFKLPEYFSHINILALFYCSTPHGLSFKSYS